MPKGKLIAPILILVLIFSMAGVVNLASARVNSADVQIFPWDIVINASPVISVNSPENCATYYGNVLLNFTFSSPFKYWVSNIESLEDVGYILDNKSYGPFPANTNLISPFNFCSNLTLGQGSHSLEAFFDYAGLDDSTIKGPIELTTRNYTNTVVFDVLPAVPTVVIQPVEINGTALILNLTVNEPVVKFAYSLDNQDNVSIVGNTTITNLPYGQHDLAIYATNQVGNIGASQTINFTIVNIAKPFPTAPVVVVSIVAVAVVVVAVTSLLVYFKKHKR